MGYPLRNEGGRAVGAGGCAPAECTAKAPPAKTRPPAYDLIPATRNGQLDDGTACASLDLADPVALPRALDRIAPDVIVNAAAYTAVDRAEDEPEPARIVNADAVAAIGAWAARCGARVVHYSTDYVFAGATTHPYAEADAPGPLGVYGRTKLAGELALRASGARHLIFRTAWVYAARGHNFLRTMLRLGAERDTLRVVDDQVGAPTPAGVIADTTAVALGEWLRDDDAARDGLYHLVTLGQTSWCGFARAIFARARPAGLLKREPVVEAIATRDYPTRARRPASSVLDTTKLRRAFAVTLPDWQSALDRVIAELARAPR